MSIKIYRFTINNYSKAIYNAFSRKFAFVFYGQRAGHDGGEEYTHKAWKPIQFMNLLF